MKAAIKRNCNAFFSDLNGDFGTINALQALLSSEEFRKKPLIPELELLLAQTREFSLRLPTIPTEAKVVPPGFLSPVFRVCQTDSSRFVRFH